MMKFTVKRSEWARGGKNGDAMLLNANGYMCCLGFAMCQLLGVSKDDILGAPMPARVLKNPSFLTEVSQFPCVATGKELMINSTLASWASSFNDDGMMTEVEREQRLTALFAKKDITIEFVD